jgi:hypothetical protein
LKVSLAASQQSDTGAYLGSREKAIVHGSSIDPSLARIIDAWPTLPPAIHRAMVALVEGSK